MNLRSISGPYNGLREKIDFIRRCYPRSITDPAVRRFAEVAAGRGTRMEQVKNLYESIRTKVNYLPDPVGVEMTKSPSVMLKEIAERGSTSGDCDDQAALSFTLLKAIGIPAKLRVVWFKKIPMPQHIYALAQVEGSWVAFDTTTRRGFGAQPDFSKKEDFK
jgi:transglutaminase-like putative cysteine protease